MVENKWKHVGGEPFKQKKPHHIMRQPSSSSHDTLADGPYAEVSDDKRADNNNSRCRRHVSSLVAIVSCIVAIGCSVAAAVSQHKLSQCQQQQQQSGWLPTSSSPSLAIRVPLVMQVNDYFCGAASAAAVLRGFGWLNVTQEILANEMGTNDIYGTEWSRIVNATVSRGFSVSVTQAMTRDDIQRALFQRHAPTIIDYQAWENQAGTYYNSYSAQWEDGHFSVVVGMNATGFLLMDPYMYIGTNNMSTTYGFLSYEDLAQRWHDISEGVTIVRNLGITISSSTQQLPEMQWPSDNDVLYTF